ncbi:MAG: cytosine deaminase [Beijerinckiaceae bacterium]|nr:cytosine deaminase [Beijerinckiaceae bacterium]MCZ8299705.1 cytosine deaminase [Beijerinckiaceae bacterium]
MTFQWPPRADEFWLDNLSLPECLVRSDGAEGPVSDDRLKVYSLLIQAGRMARIVEGRPPADGRLHVDAGRRLAMPLFVDIHTHLDKGHIFARSPNPDGTFFGARETVGRDREARWDAEDVRARMDFALRAAYAHGTGAIRTHLDSIGKQIGISWPVFDEIRAEWRGRVDLQAVCLMPIVSVIDVPDEFEAVLRQIRRYGGILGAVTFLGERPDARLDAALDRMIGVAKAEGFDLDFHVDESDSPDARSLERIADALIRHRFTGKALAGHCCSLALMEDGDRARVVGKLAEAGLNVVSLPMCNLYLQDRQSGRTPRWRGVAPLHELDAAGVSTMVSSDNTRDPFYAYGDLDAVEVFREATRILHFDHAARPWLEAITTRPAAQMRLNGAGVFAQGQAADLVLFEARTLNEWLCRPQADRRVIRNGKLLDERPPAYSDLDSLSV